MSNPQTCPEGFSLIGTTCYRDCASGYTANGDSCYPNCLSGTDLTSVCEKIITPRQLIGPAVCPPGTTYAESQIPVYWPAPNNARKLEFCFDTCPKPDLQKYTKDDSGSCVPKQCGINDQTQQQYPAVNDPNNPDVSQCLRANYEVQRSFAFGSCPNNKVILFKNASNQIQAYTNVNDALSSYNMNITNINPSVFGGSYENLYQCEVPCPTGYVRYEQLSPADQQQFVNYGDGNYCFKANTSPLFVDPQTEIPSLCSNKVLWGTTTTVKDALDPVLGKGYTQEFIPTPVKITQSLGLFDKNKVYAKNDVVATFQDLKTLRFKGPFFRILDPTKASLGLPSYTPSNLYYADPNYVNGNAFATSVNIGTMIDYDNIQYAGENDFYKYLCSIDPNTQDTIYCPPLCVTQCNPGDENNFGLEEPYYKTNQPQLWEPNVNYIVGNVVIYSGTGVSIYYRCITNHTSTTPPPNANWTTFNAWSSASVLYNVGDVVYVTTLTGQILYKCLVAHTSSNLIFPPNNDMYWQDYGTNITAAVCYPRCGSSVLFKGEGPLCDAQIYQNSTFEPSYAYSYCPNNSEPIPSQPGYANTNQCFSLCPLYNTLKVPTVFPDKNNPQDPLWATAFLNCITECPINESFQDNGDTCVKIPYKRAQYNSVLDTTKESVNKNLNLNNGTLSKIALKGGTGTLLIVMISLFGVSIFIVFVLWSQRLLKERIK